MHETACKFGEAEALVAAILSYCHIPYVDIWVLTSKVGNGAYLTILSNFPKMWAVIKAVHFSDFVDIEAMQSYFDVFFSLD